VNELLRVRSDAVVPLIDAYVGSGRLPGDWSRYVEPTGLECDLDLVKRLATSAATLLTVDKMDRWLAPRLHCALRISRRAATDEGMWAWLALESRDFVEARFKKKNQVHPWRFRGAWSRNGVARLWWGAEMTRNGPTYTDVVTCFTRTRTAEFALELMYSWHRPAAIAFARVAEGSDGGPRLTDAQARALSTRLRVYLSLRALEAFDGDEDASEEFDAEWAKHTPSLSVLMKDDVAALVGPSTGKCEESEIGRLAAWFREVVREGDATPEGSVLEDVAESPGPDATT